MLVVEQPQAADGQEVVVRPVVVDGESVSNLCGIVDDIDGDLHNTNLVSERVFGSARGRRARDRGAWMTVTRRGQTADYEKQCHDNELLLPPLPIPATMPPLLIRRGGNGRDSAWRLRNAESAWRGQVTMPPLFVRQPLTSQSGALLSQILK